MERVEVRAGVGAAAGSRSGMGATVGLGFALVSVLVVSSLLTAGDPSSEAWTGLILLPALFLATLPALARQASREGDRRLFWILVVALIAKLLATLVRFYVTFEVYDRADAADYHERGTALAEKFRNGDFDTSNLKGAIVSTNFIRVFTGIVYAVIGPSRLGGFLVFSWLAFWGLFYFYRAFVVAVPEGRRRTYARLVFFLPTLVYWPSSIGKESWMVFGLGIACFGVARLLSGSTAQGLMIGAIGFWLTGLVRPHMAGLVGVALAFAFLLRRPRAELRELAPVVKLVSLAVIAAAAFFLVGNATDFIEEKGISTEGGVTGILDQTSERTSAGGSEFTPSVFQSPAHAPIAVVNVLFRPLIIEANNAQALLAALEATFLLFLTLVRIRWFKTALASSRRHPYVVFALVYTVLFIVAFSGIANFGLLVRQKAQLLPIYLALFCLPPPERNNPPERNEEKGNRDVGELAAP